MILTPSPPTSLNSVAAQLSNWTEREDHCWWLFLCALLWQQTADDLHLCVTLLLSIYLNICYYFLGVQAANAAGNLIVIVVIRAQALMWPGPTALLQQALFRLPQFMCDKSTTLDASLVIFIAPPSGNRKCHAFHVHVKMVCLWCHGKFHQLIC